MSDNAMGAYSALDRTQGAAEAVHDAVDTAADCAADLVRKFQQRPFSALAIAFGAGILISTCIRR